MAKIVPPKPVRLSVRTDVLHLLRNPRADAGDFRLKLPVSVYFARSIYFCIAAYITAL